MTDPDAFIAQCLSRGSTEGLDALTGIARLVYLVSEAELRCDLDGIDDFVDAYGLAGVRELAASYAALGAHAIAGALHAIVEATPDDFDASMERGNDLITRRTGYDYADLRRVVLARASSHEPPEEPR